MEMIRAVIFDLDGTLIDTEKYYRVCWPKAAGHFGYHMSDEQALSLRSLGRPFAPEQFKAWYGEAFDYGKVRAYRKELMEACIEENGILIKPGAVELLAYLRSRKIVTALATANERERALRYLDKIGLSDCFDRIVCADMVEKGKPAPDIYHFACEQLKEEPQNCMAVEDSPNGAKSAAAAGCKVVYIPDQTPADESVKPLLFACCGSLSALQALFEDADCSCRDGRTCEEGQRGTAGICVPAAGAVHAVSKETAARAAALSALAPDEAELEESRRDMEAMLSYIDRLKELDTAEIEPLSHVFEAENAFREDAVTNGDGSAMLFANAPAVKDGGIPVPMTIGEQEDAK